MKPARIQVRFADLDTMGHVNNAVYLSYFEMARVHYFGQLLGTNWDWKREGVLLVRNEIDYIKPILLHHVPEITVFLIELGNKSIKMGYEVKVGEDLHTTGVSVMVAFDASIGKTIAVPVGMREALERLPKK
ncbi:MAG: hypothetical protein RL264_2159 [Bacteroidota bacterium]|jgi:acyl-CoA thioester hydrolase